LQSELSTIALSEDTKPYEVAEAYLQAAFVKTFFDSSEIVLYGEKGVYVRNAEWIIAKDIEEVFHKKKLDKLLTNNFLTEVLGHIRRRTYVNRSEFDKEPFILNLKNGLLNLQTGEFAEHSPEYLSMVQLPVKYDPKANCLKIAKFLSEVLFLDDLQCVQEYVGYVLWKEYNGAKALLLVGEGGNGKSTFILLIKALIGNENASSVSLQELEYNRFAKSDLYGKLANLFADLPDEALKATGTFKMLTGKDPIRGEYKFRNSFHFVNFAKLIFSANKVPEVYDDTTAFFRRWIILLFPNTFIGQTENKNLINELTTEEELSGFLNWALEGLQRLRANRWNFSNSKSVEEVREEYIRKSSPIQAFIMDCLDVDSNNEMPKKELFKEFLEYCKSKKLPAPSDQTFFKKLPRFVNITDTRPDIDGKRVPCFKGIRLKEEEGIRNAQAKIS